MKLVLSSRKEQEEEEKKKKNSFQLTMGHGTSQAERDYRQAVVQQDLAQRELLERYEYEKSLDEAIERVRQEASAARRANYDFVDQSVKSTAQGLLSRPSAGGFSFSAASKQQNEQQRRADEYTATRPQFTVQKPTTEIGEWSSADDLLKWNEEQQKTRVSEEQKKKEEADYSKWRDERDALIDRYVNAYERAEDQMKNENRAATPDSYLDAMQEWQDASKAVDAAGGIENLRKLQLEDAEKDRVYKAKLAGMDLDRMTFWDKAATALGGTLTGALKQYGASWLGQYQNAQSGNILNHVESDIDDALRLAAKQYLGSVSASSGRGSDYTQSLRDNIYKTAEAVGGADYAQRVMEYIDDQATKADPLMGFDLSTIKRDEDETYKKLFALTQSGTGKDLFDVETMINLQNNANTDLERAKNAMGELGGLGDFVVDAGASAIQSGLDAALTVALGINNMGAVSMLPFGMRAAGGAWAEGANSVMSRGEEIGRDMAKNLNRYAGQSGAIEMATEMLWGTAGAMSKVSGGGALDELTTKKVTGALQRMAETETGAKILGRLGEKIMGGMFEGVEEILADVANYVLDTPGMIGEDRGTVEELIVNAGKSFITGAMSGLFGEVTGAISGRMQDAQIGRNIRSELKAGDTSYLDSIAAAASQYKGDLQDTFGKIVDKRDIYLDDDSISFADQADKMSNVDLGRLAQAFEEQTQGDDYDDIERAVKRLEKGKDLTERDVARIVRNEAVTDYLAEQSGVEIAEESKTADAIEALKALASQREAFKAESKANAGEEGKTAQRTLRERLRDVFFGSAETAAEETAEPTLKDRLNERKWTMTEDENGEKRVVPYYDAERIGTAMQESAEKFTSVGEAFDRLGISRESSNDMISAYDPGQNAVEYAGEMTRFYNQGVEGRELDTDTMAETTTITPAQARIAYTAGRAEYNTNVEEGYGTETEADGLRVRDGVQGENGQSPVGQSAGVEKASGSAEFREEIAGFRGGRQVKGVFSEPVSAADLGIAGGSQSKSIRIIKESNDAHFQESKKIAESTGCNFVGFVGGSLVVDNVASRGFYDPVTNTIYARMDHAVIVGEQITKHEAMHHMIQKGQVDLSSVKKSMVKEMGQEKALDMIADYAALYEGLGMSEEEIFEELVCDSYGNMNEFVYSGHWEDAAKNAEGFKAAKRAAESVRTEGKGGEAVYLNAGAKTSIEFDANGNPYVLIDEDILEGVPQEKWVKTVKDNLGVKFPNGIRIANQTVFVNQITKDEMTFSNYIKETFNDAQKRIKEIKKAARAEERKGNHNKAKEILKTIPEAYQKYTDKLRATNNADEILAVAKGWANEELKHERKDRIVSFWKATVRIAVGSRAYTADVLVGERRSGNLILFDIYNLVPTTIEKGRTPGIGFNEWTNARQSAPEDFIPRAKDDVKQKNSLGKTSIDLTSDALGVDAFKDAAGKVHFSVNGQEVNEITAEHVRDHSAIGVLIKQAVSNKFITTAEAIKQYKAGADLMNMIMTTQDPEMTWAFAGATMFSALKKNADPQYGTTVDFTTVCRKTQEMVTAMSSAMKAAGRGLTKAEVTELQHKVLESGAEVPCPVCYVFSRWAGIGNMLDDIVRLQEKYSKFTREQITARTNELKKEIISRGLGTKNKKGQMTVTGSGVAELMRQLQDERSDMEAGIEWYESGRKSNLTESEYKDMKKRLPGIIEDIGILSEWTWASQIMTRSDYKAVPKNILFDLDAGEKFASEYPAVWKYRTTRGPSSGKAILPYSSMRSGDIIEGADPSASVRKMFVDQNNKSLMEGNMTKAQQRVFDRAIRRTAAQNLIGGQRFQSTSDFRYEYALDYIQAFWELQALGSKLQTYTKVVEFADIIAAVGGDVNLSVMPLRNGVENGKLIFSNVTGMNIDAALEANSKFDNAQLILVGINDEHILAALDDHNGTGGENIGFVIPYHTSGASIEDFISKLVENLGEKFVKANYRDYSQVQEDVARSGATDEQKMRAAIRKKILTGKGTHRNELSAEELSLIRGKSVDITGRSFEDLRNVELKALAGDNAALKEYLSWSAGVLQNLYDKMYNGEERDTMLSSTQAASVMPHEYWNTDTTRANAYVNGFIFRSYCYSLGLKPRFSWSVGTGEDAHGDFSGSEGYWKTLIDRPMYNNDGTYREQQRINVTDFDNAMLTPAYAEATYSNYKIQEPNRSRAESVGTEFGEGLKFSREIAPVFYSKLGREIEAFKGDKIGAASVVQYLKGKGVKDEDIKWSGIRTFLEGKKSVSKAELLQYIQDNQIHIEEKVLSDEGSRSSSQEYYSPDIDRHFASVDQARYYAEQIAEEKWGIDSDHVYMDNNDDGSITFGVEYDDGEDVLFTVEGVDEEFLGSKSGEATRWQEYKTPGGTNYREILYKLPNSGYSNNAMKAHWLDNVGVVAHARVQDFVVNGNKVLFVDEIQSDWHNAGEKAGYGGTQMSEVEKDEKRNEIYSKFLDNPVSKTLLKKVVKQDGWRSDLTNLDNAEDLALAVWTLDHRGDQLVANLIALRMLSAPEIEAYDKFRNEIVGLKTKSEGVPDVPFRNGTYIQYVLKDLLRKAAEGGYDYLAWTTGKMQEDRWSSDYAEGYRIEYDQDIPSFLKKYGKQWGAAITQIPLLQNGSEIAEYKEEYGELFDLVKLMDYDLSYSDFAQSLGRFFVPEYFEREEIAAMYSEEEIDRINELSMHLDEAYENGIITPESLTDAVASDVPAIPITDAMRDSVLYEGQPMFSREIGNTELLEANRQLRKDLSEMRAKLKTRTAQKEYWKGQTKVTDGRRARLDDAKKLARTLAKEHGSKIDVDVVGAKLKDLADFCLNEREFDDAFYEEARMRTYEIAHMILDDSEILRDEGDPASYSKLRDYLKSTKLYVPASMQHDLSEDYAAYRKSLAGTVTLTTSDTSATGIDVAYKELQEIFGKGLFPDINHPADQFKRIMEILESFKPVYERMNSYEMAEAVEWTANDILGRVVGEEIRQTDPTYADKMEARLKAEREKAKAALKLVRQKRDQQVEALKQHYRQMAEDKRAKRIDSEARNRLLNIARRLNNKKLDRATRALLDKYIGDLDLVSKGLTGKSIHDLQGLQTWYEAYKDKMGEDFIPIKSIEDRLKRLSQKHIKDMTQEEVADLTTILLHLENEIRTASKLIESQEKRDIYAAGMEVIDDIRGTRGKKGALGKYIVTETLSPVREIRRLTGYREHDPLYTATKELADGQRKMLDYQRRAEALVKEWTEDKAFVKRIAGKNAQEITVQGLVNGELTDVKITPAMRMALYLHGKNDGNMKHISKGGVKIPDMTLYKKGKMQEAYDQGTRVVFTRGMINKIASQMAEDERAFADTVSWYYNNMSRGEINETSELLKGFSIAGVDYYYPIDTDGNFLKKEFDAIKRDGSIEGMGFLKERIDNPTNPIMLYDMNDTLNKSISQHSKYVGLAIPVRNFNKLYGVSTFSEREVDYEADPFDRQDWQYDTSVAETIRKQWGAEAAKYIEKMMTDIQNGTGLDRDVWGSALAKARSKYAAAVLNTNASVAFKQTASYPTAAAVVGYAPLVKALKNSNRRVDLEKVEKLTALLWYRMKGFSNVELGDIGKGKYQIPKALNWIQAMDVWTTRKLWLAAEYYVETNNKDLKRGTEAFDLATAEVYNRIIEETQPNYTMMQRPQILRSESDLTRALNMFKTQPFQNFNILYDAIGNLRAQERYYKANATEENLKALKEARKGAARAISSQIISAFVFSLMQFAWDAFRGKTKKYKDDDEDEMTLLSWLKGMGINVLSSVGGMIPFGGYALELGESMVDGIAKALGGSAIFDQTFYGLSENAVESANDMGKAVLNIASQVASLMSGDDITETRIRKLVDSGMDIAQFAGVAASNWLKLAQSVARNVFLVAEDDRYVGEYKALHVTTDLASHKNEFYNVLQKAWKNDPASYVKLYDMMIEEKGFATAANSAKANIDSNIRKWGYELLEDVWRNRPEEFEEIKNQMINLHGDPFATSTKSAEENINAKIKEWEKEQAKTNSFYQTTVDSIQASSVWQQANEEQRKTTIETLLSLAAGADEKTQAKIDAGEAAGLDATEYMLYKLALSVADTNGGSHTNEDYEKAIRMVDGLTDEERSYLWHLHTDSDKNNPWAAPAVTRGGTMSPELADTNTSNAPRWYRGRRHRAEPTGQAPDVVKRGEGINPYGTSMHGEPTQARREFEQTLGGDVYRKLWAMASDQNAIYDVYDTMEYIAKDRQAQLYQEKQPGYVPEGYKTDTPAERLTAALAYMPELETDPAKAAVLQKLYEILADGVENGDLSRKDSELNKLLWKLGF